MSTDHKPKAFASVGARAKVIFARFAKARDEGLISIAM
jgi:hypothetical protein